VMNELRRGPGREELREKNRDGRDVAKAMPAAFTARCTVQTRSERIEKRGEKTTCVAFRQRRYFRYCGTSAKREEPSRPSQREAPNSWCSVIRRIMGAMLSRGSG
jgi:hypothetical protein